MDEMCKCSHPMHPEGEKCAQCDCMGEGNKMGESKKPA